VSRLPIFESQAKSILSKTSGFIAEAGFTHSLTPARNCTFGCTYCYVPTMRLQGGLKPEDWQHWGQFTTFKANAAELLARDLRAGQRIYCSPLVDPYQPAEEQRQLMPAILDALIAAPPEVFCIQTRGLLVLRDLGRLARLAQRTTLRVSFSLTTDREDVRRWYEPHCASFEERLDAMRILCDAGLRVHATLAPLLPCDPERLAQAALGASNEDMICDPFHVRQTKPTGATTRPEAEQISRVRGFEDWHRPEFQRAVTARIATIVHAAHRRFSTGTQAFQWLSIPVTT
jgi:DNA repair photolyase